MRFKYTAVAGLFFIVIPAKAERIETFWRLEPVTSQAPETVTTGEDFLEQRLLPVSMVSLDADVTHGTKTILKGSMLYLVFNGSGEIAYCTLKDRSTANQARTLGIPALDQRPCLLDSDGDGRFDHVFSVFDKYGGPPSVRGSIDGAKPLAASVAYRKEDIHRFPRDMRVSLVIVGKENLQKSSIKVRFAGSIGGDWFSQIGTPSRDGVVFDIMNAVVKLRSISNGSAEVSISIDKTIFISSDNANNLYNLG
jgi:hypothetical protein